MKTAFPRLLASVCILLSATAVSASPLDPESLLALQVVEDVEISPDGDRIVYELTRTDATQDKYERDLWILEGDQPARPLVAVPGDDSRPRWSPDGRRLAFLSTREGMPQIFVKDMDGGEEWRLTSAPFGVGGFSWSPDGARIAYSARPAPPTARRPAASGANAAAINARRALVTDRLFYRFDGVPGFLPRGRSSLYITDVKAGTATPVGPLTDGRNEPSEPAWSKDGKWLIYNAVPTTWRAETEHDGELYRVRADGEGEPEQLTDRHGPDESPIVDRETGVIAWSGYDASEPLRMSTTQRLYAMSPDGSGRRELTTRFDRNVGEVQGTDAGWLHGLGDRVAFAPGGKDILFIASDHGLTQLYRVGTNGGEVRLVPNQMRGDLREISVARNGRIAGIFGGPDQPYEVWTAEAPGQPWRQRTNHALADLPDAKLSKYESFDIQAKDSKTIQGWLIKPPNFDPSRKYPLILYAHGGPNAMYGENFYHEFQVLAGAGFIVMLTNPRGSTGYGQDFANTTQWKHPIDGAEDLIAAGEAAAKLPYVDARRLGIAGGSGGGTLAAWTIGKTSLFSAALVERPVTNWYTFITGSDAGIFFAKQWFKDYPWRNPAEYLERSPISLVENVTTPVFVIQSIEDYRTTIDQSLGYYGPLKMLGKEAKLALFPMSSHSLSRNGFPSQRLERLELIVEWFRDKLGEPAASPEASGTGSP